VCVCVDVCVGGVVNMWVCVSVCVWCECVCPLQNSKAPPKLKTHVKVILN